MVSKNKTAMGIAFIAGLLMLISGTTGFAAWNNLGEIVNDLFPDITILQVIFAIFIFIASLGGLAVIAGGILIGKDKVRTGKFIIMLGAGLGIIGLIVHLFVTYQSGELTSQTFLSLGFIGLILSIVARKLAKTK
jgi:hypothetical protein